MLQFILGVIITIAGVFMTIKSEGMLNTFGRIEFFEKYLGTDGGSRLGYRLIGILALFIGVLTATGLIEGFIKWVFSPLIKVSAPM